MQWTDEGIVLGVRRHGEANAVLELMTRAHGRHLGLVRGGFGSRLKPVLQVGNGVSATWRARLDEHLGTYTVEGMNLRAASFFPSPHAIYGVGHLAALMRLLPERDPHEALYDALQRHPRPAWRCGVAAPMVVRFELQLLSELGFGLDLAQCASTGETSRTRLCLAEIGAGGVARVRARLTPTRCCGCRLFLARRISCPPAAISPTALR